MRVLFLGHCSYVTVGPLAAALKENTSVCIDVANLNRAGATLQQSDKLIFDDFVSVPTREVIRYTSSQGKKRNVLLKLLKQKKFTIVVLRIALRFQIGNLKQYIINSVVEELYSRAMYAFLAPYDVLHFHYLDPYFLQPLTYTQPHQKIILSFWGSDLFTISGVEAYRTQLAAVGKADITTMQTVEMRQIFLSKFGHQWKEKVRLAFFGVSRMRLAQIDQAKNESTWQAFRQKHTIDFRKVVITVGYSAASGQQHLKVLRILNELSPVYKEQMHVIIPLTYNNENKEYLQEVIFEANSCDFSNTLLTEYMTDEEVVDLTVCTQILLNLRTTDAFNNAMIENLLAGNIVVSGAWLFYGTLQRWGVNYLEVGSLEELQDMIPYILDNLTTELKKNSSNAAILSKKITYEYTKQAWLDIYKELCEVKT